MRHIRRKSFFQELVSSAPLRLTIIIICFLWTLPSIGLLVSSFRPPADISSSGWWTQLAHR